jgi:hypothetical protein
MGGKFLRGLSSSNVKFVDRCQVGWGQCVNIPPHLLESRENPLSEIRDRVVVGLNGLFMAGHILLQVVAREGWIKKP